MKSFQPSGSLCNPSITVCKIETGLEVNFTTSSLGLEYFIILALIKQVERMRGCRRRCIPKTWQEV
uniref:Uncharacterized protein n=1 Tax=Anas platyrhynchos platyrhynchos TaxID=8840 RepID=A0A493SZJ1_ANAPP